MSVIIFGADLAGQKISNMADGTSASDAVTKGQLDALIKGLVWKPSVKAATTANITLSGTQTIDTIALSVGDRVLVKDQTTASANGIYVVASGTWARASDLDESAEFSNGVAVAVQQGSANGDKNFVLTTDGPITVGTTALAFGAIGGSGTSYTAGNGLTLSGSQFSVTAKSGGGLTVDGTGVYIDTAFTGLAKRYSSDVPANATAVITHNLGTTDVLWQVKDKTSGKVIIVEGGPTDANTVTLIFPTAPSSGQYRFTALG